METTISSQSSMKNASGRVRHEVTSYLLMSEFIDAKQRYARAKRRLNRYCAITGVSYNEIRAKARKPNLWLSMRAKSKRFEIAKASLLAFTAKQCKPGKTVPSHTVQPKEEKHFPLSSEQPLQNVEAVGQIKSEHPLLGYPVESDCRSIETIKWLEDRYSELDHKSIIDRNQFETISQFRTDENRELSQEILRKSHMFLNLFRAYEGLRAVSKKFLKAGSDKHGEYILLAREASQSANLVKDNPGIKYLYGLEERELKAYVMEKFPQIKFEEQKDDSHTEPSFWNSLRGTTHTLMSAEAYRIVSEIPPDRQYLIGNLLVDAGLSNSTNIINMLSTLSKSLRDEPEARLRVISNLVRSSFKLTRKRTPISSGPLSLVK